MGRVEKIHFVGIGGAGMCGIAEVLKNLGYLVTGSDLSEGPVIDRLRNLGISVTVGHCAENIDGTDVVVRSTAVKDENPEILAAIAQKKPVIPRAMMLAELMRFRYGIAIAGTHGKTTTTSLVANVLSEAGLDPSYVIGGKLARSGSHAQLGNSPYFVVEADESDASFLFLKPMVSVVTNIDLDHMGTYENRFDILCKTFIEFLHHLPFYGLAVLCIDDPGVKGILNAVQRPKLTYGFSEEAQFRAVNWQQQELISTFDVIRGDGHAPLQIQSQMPGRHNVLNTLAAIAIATEIGLSDEAIIKGIYNFQGVGRRFQLLGERACPQGKVVVIDDYGHHPEEIKATVAAARSVWPKRRLIHVFQPHRFSRTQALFTDFVDALSLADELILLNIYAAGEKAIDGITSQALSNAISQKFPQVSVINDSDLIATLESKLTDGDLVLMQGAGTISQFAHGFVESHV